MPGAQVGESLLSDARGCFSIRHDEHPESVMDEMNHGPREIRKAIVVGQVTGRRPRIPWPEIWAKVGDA